MDDPRFPRVQVLNNWKTVDAPQRVPGLPQHNLAQMPRAATQPLAPSFGPSAAPTGQSINDPHHYASLSDLLVDVGIDSILFLEVPPGRRNLLVLRNAGTTNLYVGFGNIASTNSPLYLIPNAMVMFDTVVPQNDLYVISDAGGGLLAFSYSNISG